MKFMLRIFNERIAFCERKVIIKNDKMCVN